MTLDKINSALRKGGVKFDFIGFDACLMGTLETALVTEQYADYLIGSEESEPGCGWYYTTWLSQLSKNTSISTVELSKTIIDDFNNVCKKNFPGCNTTLSVVDLAEFAGTVPEPFAAFSKSVSNLLDNKEYQTAESDTDEISHSASPSPAPADTLLPASEATEPSVEVTPVSSAVSPAPSPVPTDAPAIDKNGVYTSKEDVALYLHTYGQLPGNFITKKQAQALGWSGGYLEPYAPGMCIGGDYFGNYERALPVKKGRSYYECDIDTLHKRSRGAKRMIWSNDGLIYYTDNHYESFTLLYGGD